MCTGFEAFPAGRRQADPHCEAFPAGWRQPDPQLPAHPASRLSCWIRLSVGLWLLARGTAARDRQVGGGQLTNSTLWRMQVVDVMQDSRQKMDRLMQILRRENSLHSWLGSLSHRRPCDAGARDLTPACLPHRHDKQLQGAGGRVLGLFCARTLRQTLSVPVSRWHCTALCKRHHNSVRRDERLRYVC